MASKSRNPELAWNLHAVEGARDEARERETLTESNVFLVCKEKKDGSRKRGGKREKCTSVSMGELESAEVLEEKQTREVRVRDNESRWIDCFVLARY